MSEFQATIDQDDISIYINVHSTYVGGYVTAKKRLSGVTETPEPAQVSLGTAIKSYRVGEIGDFLSLVNVARDLAESLDELIVTRDDFKKRFHIKEARFTKLPVLSELPADQQLRQSGAPMLPGMGE